MNKEQEIWQIHKAKEIDSDLAIIWRHVNMICLQDH
jgi:hypothetical protein